MHVIGPFDRFPLAAERAYTAPEATLEEHDAMKRRAGLERTMFVQHAILAGNPARLYGFPSA